MISIEDCVELAIRGLEVYFHGSENRLIQAARGDKIDGLEAASVLKKSKNEKRLAYLEEKVLHGQYLRQTKDEVISVGLGFRMEITENQY